MCLVVSNKCASCLSDAGGGFYIIPLLALFFSLPHLHTHNQTHSCIRRGNDGMHGICLCLSRQYEIIRVFRAEGGCCGMCRSSPWCWNTSCCKSVSEYANVSHVLTVSLDCDLLGKTLHMNKKLFIRFDLNLLQTHLHNKDFRDVKGRYLPAHTNSL